MTKDTIKAKRNENVYSFIVDAYVMSDILKLLDDVEAIINTTLIKMSSNLQVQ